MPRREAGYTSALCGFQSAQVERSQILFILSCSYLVMSYTRGARGNQLRLGLRKDGSPAADWLLCLSKLPPFHCGLRCDKENDPLVELDF